jgi:hypothetical protein
LPEDEVGATSSDSSRVVAMSLKTLVVYLDIDDVLVRWEGRHREAAPGAAEFLRWLLEVAEVRWLSSWCPTGTMRPDRIATLAGLLSLPAHEIVGIRNPRGFRGVHRYPPKHEAIDFGDTRTWIWLEDEHLHRSNLDELKRRGMGERYWHCNTSLDPHALQRVRLKIEALLMSAD